MIQCYICEVAGCLLVNLSKRSTPRVCGLRRWGLSSTSQLISKVIAKFICMCFNRTRLLAVFLVLSLVRITTSTSCPTDTCPTPVFFPTTTPPAPSLHVYHTPVVSSGLYLTAVWHLSADSVVCIRLPLSPSCPSLPCAHERPASATLR